MIRLTFVNNKKCQRGISDPLIGHPVYGPDVTTHGTIELSYTTRKEVSGDTREGPTTLVGEVLKNNRQKNTPSQS